MKNQNKLDLNALKGLIESMQKAKKVFDDFKLQQFEIIMTALLGSKYTLETRKKGMPKKFYLNDLCDKKLISILSEYAPCEKHAAIPENEILFSWVENDIRSNSHIPYMNLKP